MAIYGGEENYGVIKRLYVYVEGILFQFAGGQQSMNPDRGYYFVSIDHPNYNAIISLLYMVANCGYTMQARTEPNLNESKFAVVRYIVVNWERSTSSTSTGDDSDSHR